MWDESADERRAVLAALEDGDVPGALRLLDANNANTELLRKETFLIRATSPLCLAASRGHLPILKHLVHLCARLYFIHRHPSDLQARKTSVTMLPKAMKCDKRDSPKDSVVSGSH